jgi:hypothetical protein
MVMSVANGGIDRSSFQEKNFDFFSSKPERKNEFTLPRMVSKSEITHLVPCGVDFFDSDSNYEIFLS